MSMEFDEFSQPSSETPSLSKLNEEYQRLIGQPSTVKTEPQKAEPQAAQPDNSSNSQSESIADHLRSIPHLFVHQSILPSETTAIIWRKSGDRYNVPDYLPYGGKRDNAEDFYITALNDWRAILHVGGSEPASHIEGLGCNSGGERVSRYLTECTIDTIKAISARGFDDNQDQLDELDKSLGALADKATGENREEMIKLFNGYAYLLRMTNRPNAAAVFYKHAESLEKER